MNRPATNGIFITGTDTDSGKTVFATGLIHALREVGVDAVGMKPVSAGCSVVDGELRNDDAEQLMRVGGTGDYALTNPYAYEPAIAPHIAAAQCADPINLEIISQAYAQLASDHELVIVEGAGGWRVPLDNNRDMSDIARRLRIPVLLVVGLRLGCLNHALLSRDAIRNSGCELLGWAGSSVDPDFSNAGDNIETLRSRIDAPCLGILPHAPDSTPAIMAEHVDVAALVQMLS